MAPFSLEAILSTVLFTVVCRLGFYGNLVFNRSRGQYTSSIIVHLLQSHTCPVPVSNCARSRAASCVITYRCIASTRKCPYDNCPSLKIQRTMHTVDARYCGTLECTAMQNINAGKRKYKRFGRVSNAQQENYHHWYCHANDLELIISADGSFILLIIAKVL
jgi:hypothetical protein